MKSSREQFEEWAEEVGALPWGYLKNQRTPGGGYSVQIYNYMWSAWQASRSAVTIKLPNSFVEKTNPCLDYWEVVAAMEYYEFKCEGDV